MLLPFLLLLSACTGDNTTKNATAATTVGGAVTGSLTAAGITSATKTVSSQAITTFQNSGTTVTKKTTAASTSATKAAVTTHKPENMVTLTVQCKKAVEYIKLNNVEGYDGIVPQDGIIIKQSGIRIQENENAFDVLSRILKENKILLVTDYGSTYVSNIGGLAAKSKDFGEQSGWLYSVNDVFPTYASDKYILKNGDKIAFLFSVKSGDVANISAWG